jgi:signal transduction histidine kinase
MTQSSVNLTNLNAELARAQFKLKLNKLVIPALGICSLFMWTAYYSSEAEKIWGIALAVSSGIMNAVWTGLSGPRKFGKWTIDPRSDRSDLIRWLLNLVIFDPVIVILLRLDPAATVAVWVILLLGAVAEMFDRRYRNLISVVGFCSFIASFLYLHANAFSWLQIGFFIACVSSVVLVVQMGFSYWSNALIDLEAHRRHDLDTQEKMLRLRAEAMVGQQARAISHEIKNMVMVMDLTLDSNMSDPLRREEILRHAVKKLRRMSVAVAGSVKSTESKREIVLSDLIEDIRLILQPFARESQCELNIQVDASIGGKKLKEFEGSTYLLMHNLIKNSIEAFAHNQTSRQIGLTVSKLAGEAAGHLNARIAVEDNAGGMSEDQLKKFLSGALKSTKELGTGLGGPFIFETCGRNEYKLGGQVRLGHGTTIWVDVPLT